MVRAREVTMHRHCSSQCCDTPPPRITPGALYPPNRQLCHWWEVGLVSALKGIPQAKRGRRSFRETEKEEQAQKDQERRKEEQRERGGGGRPRKEDRKDNVEEDEWRRLEEGRQAVPGLAREGNKEKGVKRMPRRKWQQPSSPTKKLHNSSLLQGGGIEKGATPSQGTG